MSRLADLYVDSCVFIAAFEDATAARAPARKLLDALAVMPGAAVTSELTLAELIAPTTNAGKTRAEREHLYLEIFDNLKIVSLMPVSRSILQQTATLRERYPHRLPDAIHLSTAMAAGCRFFMSFDRGIRRIPEELRWLTPSQEDVDAFLADHA